MTAAALPHQLAGLNPASVSAARFPPSGRFRLAPFLDQTLPQLCEFLLAAITEFGDSRLRPNRPLRVFFGTATPPQARTRDAAPVAQP